MVEMANWYRYSSEACSLIRANVLDRIEIMIVICEFIPLILATSALTDLSSNRLTRRVLDNAANITYGQEYIRLDRTVYQAEHTIRIGPKIG
jgi:hypothetical protein